MFGKKYKIIRELEDKKGNHNLDEVETNDIQINEKYNEHHKIFIMQSMNQIFPMNQEKNTKIVDYTSDSICLSPNLKSMNNCKIFKERNFIYDYPVSRSQENNVKNHLDLSILFPIEQTLSFSSNFKNLLKNNYMNENYISKSKIDLVDYEFREEICNAKNRYLKRKYHLKEYKALKENSFINREIIRNRIFTINQANIYEDYFTDDLFSTKKITPTSNCFSLIKNEIENRPLQLTEIDNTLLYTKYITEKTSNNYKLNVNLDSNSIRNPCLDNKCFQNDYLKKCNIKRLYNTDLKTFNEQMKIRFINNRIKMINNKSSLKKKNEYTFESKNGRKEISDYYITNINSLFINKSNRLIENPIKNNFKIQNPISLIFSNDKNKRMNNFKNNVDSINLAITYSYEKMNSFSFINIHPYIHKNHNLLQTNKNLTEEIENLEKEIKTKNESIRKAKESYESNINKFIILEEQKKKLNQYIHSIRGNLRVYCRIKPKPKNGKSIINFPELEFQNNINGKFKSSVRFGENNYVQTLDIVNPKTQETQTFNFDRVFTEHDTQEEIFFEVKPFIQSALDGENICIFAYGSTGSGKTFTMQGGDEENTINIDKLEINKNSGLLPRSAEFIFEEISRMKKIKSTHNLYFSAIEIYNEDVFDLLSKNLHDNENGYPKNKSNIEKSDDKNNKQRMTKNVNQKLNFKNLINKSSMNLKSNIKENKSLNIYCNNNEFVIKNLTWLKVEKKEDILKLTKEATENRRSDSTKFNSVSSRSHAIFQIKIEFTSIQTELIDENNQQNFINQHKKYSLINIVDLAGSERNSLNLSNFKNKEEIENGKRIQCEANFINKSLTTLGRIITMINEQKTNKISIPYRESKLTMLLNNSLKPESKTVMIVAVCSDENSYNMSRESLKFASNAMISV